MKRYSRKRESILAVFRETDTHPDAEWVYQKLKPQYPDLSFATVYRNIRELVEEGQLVSVGNVNGRERYDACTKSHTHVVCEKCGKVIDLFEVTLPAEYTDEVGNKTGFLVRNYGLNFFGLCETCRKEEPEHERHE